MTTTMPHGHGLTPDMADLARVFTELHAQRGCAPTVRELAAEMDTCLGNIARLLDRLEERGWITRLPGRARGVALLHSPPPLEETPVEITGTGHAYLAAVADCPTA